MSIIYTRALFLVAACHIPEMSTRNAILTTEIIRNKNFHIHKIHTVRRAQPLASRFHYGPRLKKGYVIHRLNLTKPYLEWLI